MRLPDRVLILAPHSDDEVFMAAGVIRRALAQGAKASVCVVTNGDYLCPDPSKGARRLAESLDALRLLGMEDRDIYFLGYPDTGFEPESSFLSRLYAEPDPRRLYPSACGSATYGIPGGKREFRFERSGRHAPYNKAAFLEDLNELLRLTAPELILTTSPWDTHGDHAALAHFTRDILRDMPETRRPALWESLIHSPAGDDRWPLPDAPYDAFTCPPGLEDTTDLRWDERIRVPLPEEMLQRPVENHLKYRAIQAYRSALGYDGTPDPVVLAYLLAFTKAEEIFWEVKFR
jgi:LmbE family N-acetylglucosaminyl deacetylase